MNYSLSNIVSLDGKTLNYYVLFDHKKKLLFSGVQAFEIMAIAAVGNNLITYLINEMHFSLSKSANTVTNFVGTVFFMALLGGYLADSYLGSFWTMLIFGFVELSVSLLSHITFSFPCTFFGLSL